MRQVLREETKRQSRFKCIERPKTPTKLPYVRPWIKDTLTSRVFHSKQLFNEPRRNHFLPNSYLQRNRSTEVNHNEPEPAGQLAIKNTPSNRAL